MGSSNKNLLIGGCKPTPGVVCHVSDILPLTTSQSENLTSAAPEFRTESSNSTFTNDSLILQVLRQQAQHDHAPYEHARKQFGLALNNEANIGVTTSFPYPSKAASPAVFHTCAPFLDEWELPKKPQQSCFQDINSKPNEQSFISSAESQLNLSTLDAARKSEILYEMNFENMAALYLVFKRSDFDKDDRISATDLRFALYNDPVVQSVLGLLSNNDTRSPDFCTSSFFDRLVANGQNMNNSTDEMTEWHKLKWKSPPYGDKSLCNSDVVNSFATNISQQISSEIWKWVFAKSGVTKMQNVCSDAYNKTSKWLSQRIPNLSPLSASDTCDINIMSNISKIKMKRIMCSVRHLEAATICRNRALSSPTFSFPEIANCLHPFLPSVEAFADLNYYKRDTSSHTAAATTAVKDGGTCVDVPVCVDVPISTLFARDGFLGVSFIQYEKDLMGLSTSWPRTSIPENPSAFISIETHGINIDAVDSSDDHKETVGVKVSGGQETDDSLIQDINSICPEELWKLHWEYDRLLPRLNDYATREMPPVRPPPKSVFPEKYDLRRRGSNMSSSSGRRRTFEGRVPQQVLPLWSRSLDDDSMQSVFLGGRDQYFL